MKYYLFAWELYAARGGIGDYQCSFDDIIALKVHIMTTPRHKRPEVAQVMVIEDGIPKVIIRGRQDDNSDRFIWTDVE